MRQIALLGPARMKLAHPAYRLAIQFQACGTPRMQRGMRGGNTNQALGLIAQQGFHIFFYIIEIHLRSEEHTSELQSLMRISYAVFCLKKKTQIKIKRQTQLNTRL